MLRQLTTVVALAAAATFIAVAASADVRGPDGETPVFRYVYPAAASPDAIDKLYRDDLKGLRDETAKLQTTDGGTLSGDHRAYLAARQTAIDRRYAEARSGASTLAARGGASTN